MTLISVFRSNQELKLMMEILVLVNLILTDKVHFLEIVLQGSRFQQLVERKIL